MNLIHEMHRQYIIPVIRESDPSTLESASLALGQGGLQILELTLMSDSVFSVIKNLSSQKNMIIGAGTVLNVTQAQRAVDSGAQFLVSPGFNIEILKFSQKLNLPFFPGVLTPTEIMEAQSQGCELVKIFPISAVGGTSYLQALKGPFPNLKWMPTGGVSLSNLGQFLMADAFCVGMGGQLIPNEKLKSKDWSGLTEIAVKHIRQLEIERVP